MRKAMDMSRMMAQLTMEAITATLKPKVSCGGTALHTGLPEDQSAVLPFQAQVRRPDPTIWWPEGQWNMSTVPSEVPSPRTTCKVPLGGGWS